jgi:hypothetical protein
MAESKKPPVDEPRQSSPAGLSIRQQEPINLEMPFDEVESCITPTEPFYIRMLTGPFNQTSMSGTTAAK